MGDSRDFAMGFFSGVETQLQRAFLFFSIVIFSHRVGKHFEQLEDDEKIDGMRWVWR